MDAKGTTGAETSRRFIPKAPAGRRSFCPVIPGGSGRFDPLVIQDPSSRLGIVAEDPTRTPGLDALGAGWNAFRQSHGADWRIWLDRRSGSPTLVEGPGIRWFAPGCQVGPIELESA